MREFGVGVAKLWTLLLNINCKNLHIRAPYDPAVIFSISENDSDVLFGGYHDKEFHLYNKKDNRIDNYKLFNEIVGGFTTSSFHVNIFYLLLLHPFTTHNLRK